MSDLFENILTETYVWEKVQAIKEGKKMTWEQIAVALYKILDDIDTLDDACRENSEAFRSLVMKTQAQKGKYMVSLDGMTVQRVDEDANTRWNVFYKDPSQPGQLIKMKKVFLAPSREVAMKQGGLLLRREAGPDHELEVIDAKPVQESANEDRWLNKLEATSQEMFGKDYQELDSDQQEAVRNHTRAALHKSTGRTYRPEDFYTTNYGRPNESRIRIEPTSKTSRASAVELAQELGFMDAEKRGQEFLGGKSFVVTYDENADPLLPDTWKKDYRVRITSVSESTKTAPQPCHWEV